MSSEVNIPEKTQFCMHNAQGISWNGSDTELAPFPRCCFVAWLDSFDVFLDTLI